MTEYACRNHPPSGRSGRQARVGNHARCAKHHKSDISHHTSHIYLSLLGGQSDRPGSVEPRKNRFAIERSTAGNDSRHHAYPYIYLPLRGGQSDRPGSGTTPDMQNITNQTSHIIHPTSTFPFGEVSPTGPGREPRQMCKTSQIRHLTSYIPHLPFPSGRSVRQARVGNHARYAKHHKSDISHHTSHIYLSLRGGQADRLGSGTTPDVQNITNQTSHIIHPTSTSPFGEVRPTGSGREPRQMCKTSQIRHLTSYIPHLPLPSGRSGRQARAGNHMIRAKSCHPSPPRRPGLPRSSREANGTQTNSRAGGEVSWKRLQNLYWFKPDKLNSLYPSPTVFEKDSTAGQLSLLLFLGKKAAQEERPGGAIPYTPNRSFMIERSSAANQSFSHSIIQSFNHYSPTYSPTKRTIKSFKNSTSKSPTVGSRCSLPIPLSSVMKT